MRLPSALILAAAATVLASCSIPVAQPQRPEPTLASLRELGVEGKHYFADYGADRAYKLNRVWAIGNDLLLEDVTGSLLYMDGTTMTPKWAYHGLPRTFDRAPDYTDTMVVGVCKGRVYALTRRAGVEVIDPAPVAMVPSGGVVASESTLYVPTFRTPRGNKTILSVNLADGYQGWGLRTQADIVVDLAKAGIGGGDIVYAATEDGTIHGIPMYVANKLDPEPAWTTSVHAGIHRNLAVAGEDLGVVTDDSRLVCLDRITGAQRWTAYPGPGEEAASAAQFSPSNAYYVCGGEMRAYDRATGMHRWSHKHATTFVAERGMRTILSDGKGTLFAVETASGKQLGWKSMPGWRFPARAAKDATVVGVSNTGMVVAVETGF